MLTKQESDFVMNYKLTANASDSYIKAGYKCTPKSAKVMACRLLKKPHIASIVEKAEANLVNTLVSPLVNLPPKEYMKLPTRDEYLLKAWKRTEPTPSSMKEETQSKYFEIAGKALGVFTDQQNTQVLIYNDQNPTVNKIDGPNTKIALLSSKLQALEASQSSLPEVSPIVDLT